MDISKDLSGTGTGQPVGGYRVIFQSGSWIVAQSGFSAISKKQF